MTKVLFNGTGLRPVFRLVIFAAFLLWADTVQPAVFKSESFTIRLPENWDNNPQRIGSSLVFYTLPELGPQACLLIAVQASANIETSDFTRAVKSVLKEQVPGINFLLEREVEQAGARWNELIYAYSGMEFLQVMTVKGGGSYSFMATTPEELFKERLPGFRDIFSTWRFE